MGQGISPCDSSGVKEQGTLTHLLYRMNNCSKSNPSLNPWLWEYDPVLVILLLRSRKKN